MFSYFCSKNIDSGCSLDQTGGSYEYPRSMFWEEIWIITVFLSENFQFLVVKFSICLIRRVFVMVIKKKACADTEGPD